MTRIARLLGVGVAASVVVALAGCSAPPPGTSGDAVDAAYGIPPNSVPSEVMRPDGLMINGLLPLPPNSGS